MSDKNEYWKELFGDDFPEDLAKEIGIPTDDVKSSDQKKSEQKKPSPQDDNELFSLEDESEWLSLDQDVFNGSKDDTESSISDTNVIPSGKRISDSLGKGALSDIRGASPINDEDYLDNKFTDIDDDDYDDEKAVFVGGRRRNGVLGGLMYFAFVVGASLILACVVWLVASDVLALTREEATADVTITEADNISDVARKLKEKGLIEYKAMFTLYADLFKAEEKIAPGTYSLSTTYDYRALVRNMSEGSSNQVSVKVTIPEGKTIKETFQILEEKEVCSYDDLMDAATNYDFKYEFLDSSTLGTENRLEGYLFPDTYDFFINISDASSVIDTLLLNFDKRMTDNSIYELVEGTDYSLYDILKIASMIQNEAASDEEMPTVSSVIHNRLAADMELGINATIQYVLEERTPHLSSEELNMDSPYNSYLNKELPPTPVSNPGIDAIKAAIEPETTDYLYYALSVEEHHEFFKTYEGQEKFVNSEKYMYYEG